MIKFYKICNEVIRVILPDTIEVKNDNILAEFMTEETNYKRTLEFEMVDELEACKGELVYKQPDLHVYQYGNTQIRYKGALENSLEQAYLCIIRCDDYSKVQVKKSQVWEGITNKMILNAMEAEHLIVQNDGILLHSSYILWQGNAVLFTAPSGTGKSTQADLWCKYEGAEIINGDRAAVMVQETKVRAMGIPFSGSSGIYRNVEVHLSAIVYLEQAKENRLVRLAGRQAFARVWEGCSINVWNREDMEKCSQTVMDIILKVPVYLLQCTPDQRAVELLKQELLKQEL